MIITKNNQIPMSLQSYSLLPHRRRQGRCVAFSDKLYCTYDYNNVWIRKVVGNDKTIFIPENYQTTVQIDNNTITHHYLWTPNTQDKLLADVTPTNTLWSLTDHLGSIRDIIGNSTTHLIYDAFGNLISGTNPILFAYTGKAFDTSTSLQNNINRWYDPTVGRWLSTDPIGFEGNDTNLYRYCHNNSPNFIDPNGNDWLDCMNACIADNDPLPYALEAAIRSILLYGGLQSKVMLGNMFIGLGFVDLGKDIVYYANVPGMSRFTNITSVLGTTLSKLDVIGRSAMWHKLGGIMAGGLAPFQVAYGLALTAVESHCLGWCCTASYYGIPYNHKDGNVMDSWKNFYFGE